MKISHATFKLSRYFSNTPFRNDKPDNENGSFESKELQAFLNISEELDSGEATGAENYPGKYYLQ